MTLTSATTIDHIPDPDLLTHAADDIRVNAIRNGQLVEVYYNELTPEERRAAEVVTNHLYEYYG